MFLELLTALHAHAANNFETYRECNAVKGKSAPNKDLPSHEQIAQLKGCNAEGPYYGIGESVDYKKARLCSFAQRENEEGVFWGGETILYMIYANGYGVTRNLELALMYACEIEAAPAEMDARIRHIEQLGKSGSEKPDHPLDFCDDITSGYAQGFCQSLISDRKSADRAVKLAKLPFNGDKKFEALKLSALKFRDARVDNEVDQSGTARSAQALQEQDIQDQDFIESVEKFAANKSPHFDLKKENDLMNKTFKKIMASKDKDLWGTVTKDGIIKTQKAWVAYRNAWRTFAGPAKADLVDAWFTKKRTHMLNSFAPEK
jgi:hypothetical protein